MNTTTRTHAALKGTTHAMTSQEFHGPFFYERFAARLVERFQPGYFEERNEFTTTTTEGGTITLEAPLVTLYVFDKKEVEGLKTFGGAVSCEYVEKVNRHKLTLKNFKLEHNAFKESKPKKAAKVTFRKGGDYTATSEGGRLVYGPTLKSGNFTPAGFTITRLDGSQVEYTFDN
jgi:hypothetical protein